MGLFDIFKSKTDSATDAVKEAATDAVDTVTDAVKEVSSDAADKVTDVVKNTADDAVEVAEEKTDSCCGGNCGS